MNRVSGSVLYVAQTNLAASGKQKRFLAGRYLLKNREAVSARRCGKAGPGCRQVRKQAGYERGWRRVSANMEPCKARAFNEKAAKASCCGRYQEALFVMDTENYPM